MLTAAVEDADAFEGLVDAGVAAKTAANWLMGDVAALANEHKVPLHASGLGVEGLRRLLALVETGTINAPTAKELLGELYVSGGDAEALVRDRGLAQVSDEAQLAEAIDAAIAANPDAAADFRAGLEKALGRMVGHVMKATGNKAQPQLVNRMLRERLAR